MPSYGEAVKEKTFSIVSGSAAASGMALKVSDCSLDRHIVFQQFCSLSAIQVRRTRGAGVAIGAAPVIHGFLTASALQLEVSQGDHKKHQVGW